MGKSKSKQRTLTRKQMREQKKFEDKALRGMQKGEPRKSKAGAFSVCCGATIILGFCGECGGE